MLILTNRDPHYQYIVYFVIHGIMVLHKLLRLIVGNCNIPEI